jgi:uncharacterized RDD family membrane protein YckC
MATIIDIVSIGMLSLIVGMFIGSLYLSNNEDGFRNAMFGEATPFVSGTMFAVPPLYVMWTVWEGVTGAALGKLALGIKIMCDNGRPAALGRLLLRSTVKHAGNLLMFAIPLTHIEALAWPGAVLSWTVRVGFFLVLCEPRQAIHDIVVGTAVYRVKGPS